MECISSFLSLSTNAGNSNTAKFNPLHIFPLKRPHFSNAPSLWCSSSAASYSGLKLKLSPIRCSLNHNDWVSSPNSKARRGGVGFRAIAGSALILSTSLQVGLLFGYWDLVNFLFNNFMNQVFKAFHYPGQVTPAHFNPVHFAVGIAFILMWTFVVYKWAKTSGVKGPDNAPIQVIQPQSQLVTVKLTESNYLVWRQQILAAARGYGLEHFLTGESTIPQRFLSGTSDSTNTINPEFLSWNRQDQLMASWLLSSLSESLLVTTVGLTTSREIWECLEVGFSSQSRAKVMQYKLQLQSLRKGDMGMREYLNKIKSCCDVLGAAGQRISDEDQTLYILSGLSSEYNPVMVTLSSKIEPYTLKEVHAMLLSFESRLEGVDSQTFGTEGSSPSANITTQHSVRGRGTPQRGMRGRNSPYQFPYRGGRNNFRCNSQRQF